MIEEPCHGDALLLASGEDILPLADCVPAALAVDEVREVHHLQELCQMSAELWRAGDMEGIGDLVLQAARREVGCLRASPG